MTDTPNEFTNLGRAARVARLSLAVGLAGAVLAACAASPRDVPALPNRDDPLESLNRFIFDLNTGVEIVVLRPVAVAYRDLVPYPVQDSVHNFLTNLTEPVTALNQILQGDVDEAGNTMGRFMANSTIGIGGVFAVVGQDYREFHHEDFGQTLATWGLGEGPYLMLPVIGPSNSRDLIGVVVDYFTDPFNIWGLAANSASNANALLFARSAAVATDTWARNIDNYDALRENSVDFYARLRSAYRQRRNAEIQNLGLDDTPPLPDMSEGADEVERDLSMDPAAQAQEES